MKKYDHKKIEAKWQKIWAKQAELYAARDDSNKPKFYCLDMFPYPSGAGLHAGHVESYTATDIVSRYMRLKGKNVLHPQGWDAFGLPAENYAVKNKIHPTETTREAVTTFKKQMNLMGFSYDWSRELNSSQPDYYKWTQWFFLLLYKNGLAYKALAKVNWCSSCQTVLANEQAEGGVCERCGSQVAQKDMEQWFFKITDFIENKNLLTPQPPFERGAKGGYRVEGNRNHLTSGLIGGLDKVDWPESTKAAQKNWIGRSEGAEFELQITNYKLRIKVYTTRLDTVFGMTYVVIAPEHPLITNYKLQITNYKEVEEYITKAKNKTELERMESKEKTGVRLEGVSAVNPFNGEELPLFVADYVLAHYGTGAIMAVPAHDERDWEFAKQYDLPIIEVITPHTPLSKGGGEGLDLAFTGDGILVNSENYTGLTSAEAREKMAEWLEKQRLGKRQINYKIRDWLVSRQRYWGAPIPIIYCAKCGETPVPEKDLPVELPTDVDFMPTGESPLAKSKSFHKVKCPVCASDAKRESDTMDTFVCSSWYYFRYADVHNKKEFAGKKMLKKWLPVDLYVGGAEHTVLHLLYSRFFTKVLHNLGYIDFDEPFLKLRHQGIILAEDGRKMSKSLGNVVNPDEVIKHHGADALRLFEMFMGPLEYMKPWNTRGIIGQVRFLEKIWNLFQDKKFMDCGHGKTARENVPEGMPQLLHKTIKKVGQDIENLRFNTAISQLMIFINFAGKAETMPRAAAEKFLILLSPFAPHLAEELWENIKSPLPPFVKGGNNSIFKEKWPGYNPDMIKDETINLVIQINGKARDMIKVSAEISEEEARQLAMTSEKIKKWLMGKEVVKVIFVKGRLVNIVIK